MKKVIFILIFGILLIGVVGVVAQENVVQTQGSSNSLNNVDNSDVDLEQDASKGEKTISKALNVRERLKEKKMEEVQNEKGDKINLRLMENNRIRLKVGEVFADCDCELEQEQVQNRTRLKVKLSNGNFKEIKIMPDVASETALKRLRLKVCSEDNNCSIELKEVALKRRTGNETDETGLAYEIQAERHSRILWLFRKKMQVQSQVDAETGEIIRVKKSWWAFLAAEPEE